MPQMIMKDGELIRISPKNPRTIEFSANNGLVWGIRCATSIAGEFQDLVDAGHEIVAQTDRGIYYSTNSGRTWGKRR